MAELRVETPHPGVRLLVLAREGKRNALSRDLIAALGAQVRQAEAEGMRALVLAGAGPAFCAGADFADLAGDGSDEGYDAEMSGLTEALERSPLVSFAAVHGACIGAGLDLALACDFRVAAPDAVFALPAVAMGILYNPVRLARILPALGPAAARLLLLAERLDRDRALAAGIATHAGGQDAALALAARAAELPPKAQAAAKAFLSASRAPDFNPEDWQARRRDLLASDERRAALRRAKGSTA